MDPVPDPVRTISRNTLKLAAIFFMLLNHIAWIFLPEGTFVCDLLTGIGYFTAPVMCYLLAEGIFLTQSVRRYLLRLFLFALLSQVPYDLAFTKDTVITFTGLNMIYTLWISLLLLMVHTRPLPEPVKWILSVLLVLATVLADWGILAPVFTLMFYFAGNTQKAKREVWALVVLITGITFAKWTAAIGPLLAAVCVVCFYKSPLDLSAGSPEDAEAGQAEREGHAEKAGQKEKGNKKERVSALSQWFFYLFYPLHLLILGLIRIYLKL